MKSSLRATDRVSASVIEALRFSLLAFGSGALTAGPGALRSTFPSTSSRGRGASWFAVLGSLDGCVGFGEAKKYECERASLLDIRLRGSYVRQRARRLRASAVAAVNRSRRGGLGNCPTGT